MIAQPVRVPIHTSSVQSPRAPATRLLQLSRRLARNAFGGQGSFARSVQFLEFPRPHNESVPRSSDFEPCSRSPREPLVSRPPMVLRSLPPCLWEESNRYTRFGGPALVPFDQEYLWSRDHLQRESA